MKTLAGFVMGLLALSGCGYGGGPARYRTTFGWVEPPPAASGSSAAAAPKQLYVTYLDGELFRAQMKVVRCTVLSDNALACVEEADADRALSGQAPPQ
jgi:hypothetical protein